MKKKETGPDVIELITRMQQQLAIMERKIDVLIGKAGSRPAETKPPAPKPFQQPQQQGQPRERIMHKAVCADCSKECEVPFKPTGDRPVYCKECYSKRRVAGISKPAPLAAINMDKPAAGAGTPEEKKKPAAKKKPAEKKKPAAKKKKAKK